MKTIDKAIKVRHALPGRVRYRLPGLKRRRSLEAPLLQMLETTTGVRLTRINPKCDSLVVWGWQRNWSTAPMIPKPM